MRRGKARPKTSRQSNNSHPPSFIATIGFKRKARFSVASALANASLTRAMLLNHLVMNIASGTSNYRLLSGFKLNRIEIWSPGSSAFAPSTCSVEWTSTYGPTTIVSDTSMTTTPAHLLAQPPLMSLSSFWSITGSNESDSIALITAPASSIIDITYECRLQNGETPQNDVSTNNGTTGAIYMTPLFGLTTTSTVPVSYPSLV